MQKKRKNKVRFTQQTIQLLKHKSSQLQQSMGETLEEFPPWQLSAQCPTQKHTQACLKMENININKPI